MTSLTDKSDRLRTALTGVSGLAVYRYQRPPGIDAPFCVWYGGGETGSFDADGHKGEQGLTFYVDYYTKDEDDVTVDRIQNALDAADRISFTYDDALYEEDTGLIHHSWTVWVI